MNNSNRGILLFGMAFVAIAACTTNNNTTSTTAPDAHNSQNSLDWAGVYSNDNTLLRLGTDQSYSLDVKVRADSVASHTGSFSWDEDGQNIKLSGSDEWFKVGENQVIPLDEAKAAVETEALTKEEVVLTGGYWKLTEVNGKSAASFGSNFGRDAGLQFDGEKKMVAGNSGCNQVFGPYESSDGPGKIKIEKLRSTLMMCPSMELEQEFTETIEKVEAYEIANGTLLLKGSEGNVLFRFDRALARE